MTLHPRRCRGVGPPATAWRRTATRPRGGKAAMLIFTCALAPKVMSHLARDRFAIACCSGDIKLLSGSHVGDRILKPSNQTPACSFKSVVDLALFVKVWTPCFLRCKCPRAAMAPGPGLLRFCDSRFLVLNNVCSRFTLQTQLCTLCY